MKWLAALFAIAILGLAPCAQAHQKQHRGLKIIHPYTVEPAADANETAVMMKITSSGGGEDTLVSASTPIAETVLITSGTGESSGRVIVPDNRSVELTRKGSHLVLKGLRKRLVPYDSFPVTLTFVKAGSVEVEVLVEGRE